LKKARKSSHAGVRAANLIRCAVGFQCCGCGRHQAGPVLDHPYSWLLLQLGDGAILAGGAYADVDWHDQLTRAGGQRRARSACIRDPLALVVLGQLAGLALLQGLCGFCHGYYFKLDLTPE
jgi:hypothetical protein